MVPVPVIEVEEGEFRLNNFLRQYWYLFIFIGIFSVLTVFLASSFSTIAGASHVFSVLGVTFDLQVISISASLLVTYLGIATILWTAFENRLPVLSSTIHWY